MAELNLNVKDTTLVDAAFWPRNARPPEKRIIISDGSDRNVTQILLLEVGYLTVNTL
jgi:hypothetical protein